jgi:hypothetical protein
VNLSKRRFSLPFNAIPQSLANPAVQLADHKQYPKRLSMAVQIFRNVYGQFALTWQKKTRIQVLGHMLRNDVFAYLLPSIILEWN